MSVAEVTAEWASSRLEIVPVRMACEETHVLLLNDCGEVLSEVRQEIERMGRGRNGRGSIPARQER